METQVLFAESQLVQPMSFHAPCTMHHLRYPSYSGDVGEYETPPEASYSADRTVPVAPPSPHSDSDS